MSTTELITPPRAPSPPEPGSGAHSAASADPTLGEMVVETAGLVGVVPGYGPPVALVAAPWLLLSLMLAGPFAVLVTLVVLLFAMAALVALIGAILAAPYLVFRHLRGYRAPRASMRVPAPRVVVGASR